ncbi:MAG: shikimate kinase [Nitrospirales bacterium]|nr:MAG: shikimate kinase [Nitrospirales bacterium]
MNIILIGYRGTGKSTVAKILGQRLERTVISTDTEIVKEVGQSIPQIVEQFGWDHFRELETQMCRKLHDQTNLVIDTGGGLILKEENVNILKANSTIFWLTAEVPTIVKRISGDTQRPSLSGTKTFVEEIEDILKERTPKYQAAADHVIPTDRTTPHQMADTILSLIAM